MALATLSIDLTAKVAQFEQDLKKAAVASEKVSADMRAAFGTVGAAIGGITGALSVGFVTQLVTASIDAVDALNDVSDATGASVENISALQDVAARTGTEFAAVETALLKLNSVLSDATPGSKQAAILSSIGLSADELRKLDPAEAVLEVSKALSGYADDGDKARLVQELFGKSAKDVAAFMKDLAEQGKLVASVTTEQTQEAEKFNKALAVMKANAADVTRTISIDLITSLNDVAQAFKDGEAAGKGFFAVANNRYWENVDKFYASLGGPFATIAESVDEYTGKVRETEASIKKLEGTSSAYDQMNLGNLREKLQGYKELLGYYQKLNGQTSTAGAGRGSVNPELPKPSVGGVDTDTKDAKGAASRARSERERALKAESDFRIKLGRDHVIEQGKLLEAENEAYQKWIAETEAAYQAFADARTAAAVQDLSAMAQSNEALALQVQEIGLTTDQLSALKLARMDETIAQKEATLATAAANGLSYEEISALEQKIELLKKQRELTASGQIAQAAADTRTEQEAASKAYADSVRNGLEGAFSAAFRDSADKPLEAFVKAFENRMFTTAATSMSDGLMTIAKNVFGSTGGSSGGGLGDFIGSLFSFDGGGYTGSGARSGGVDGKGGFLSILHPQETVVDHTKGQTGTGGGISIVQHINVDSRSDAASIRAAMHQAKQETLAAIQQSRRAGGAYA